MAKTENSLAFADLSPSATPGFPRDVAGSRKPVGGRTGLLALVVALAAIGVYANSLGNGFAMDDEPIILRNDNVHGIQKVGTALTSPYWPGAPPRMALYRPVATASYAIGWELWGQDATGFHAVNVLLHATVTVLLLLLLLQLGASAWPAAFGASLFAVHPVHVEAVANVVGRAELLAALFYLAACLIYLRRTLPVAVRAPAIGICWLLALGSKEIAVTLPVVLLILEVGWPETDGESEESGAVPRVGIAHWFGRVSGEWKTILALMVAAGTYGVARWLVLGEILGNDVAAFLSDLSPADRIAAAVGVWPEYARLLFWPVDLVVDYSPAVLTVATFGPPRVWLGLILGLSTGLLSIAAWNRSRLLALGILWFAVVVFPVSNLAVPVGILLAERTLYLPSVGLAFAATAAAIWIGSKLRQERMGSAPPRRRLARRRLIAIFCLAVLLLAGWRTWQRNPVWESSASAIRALAENHPESYRVMWARAEMLFEDGRTDAALTLYGRALALVPDHHSLLRGYGLRLVLAGRAIKGEQVLRRAREIVPEYPLPHVYLSQSLLNQGEYEHAVQAVAFGLGHTRAHRGYYHQLAFAFAGIGEWEPALLARQISIGLTRMQADGMVGEGQWRHLSAILCNLGRSEDRSALPADFRNSQSDCKMPRNSTGVVS